MPLSSKLFLISLPLILLNGVFPLATKPKAKASSTTNSQRLFQQATKLYYEGKVEEALKVHENIIAMHPSFQPSYLELIAISKEYGDMDRAFRVAEALYKKDRSNQNHLHRYFITAVQNRSLTTARELEPLLQSVSAEVMLYQGILAFMHGSYNEAIVHFDLALTHDNWLFGALYFKALALQKQGNHPAAINEFTLLLKKEPNFIAALYPLALSYESNKQYLLSLNTLYRARNNLPHSIRITNKIASMEKTHATLIKSQPTPDKVTQRANGVIPKATSFSPATPENPTLIRVGLVENVRSIAMKAGSDFTLTNSKGKVVRGLKNSLLTADRLNNTIRILDNNNKILISDNQKIILNYNDPSAATAIFDIMNGAGYFFASVVTRSYRGSIELVLPPKNGAGITVINELSLEEYLYSVVPAEMPASWPSEALKVQAVAARTYALSQIGSYANAGFDVKGSISSQAYIGLGGEHTSTTAAVDATAHMVLYTKKKELLITYYSANHGGYSEEGTIVWLGARGFYHQAVPDLHEPKRKNYLPLHELALWLRERPITHSSWPKYHTGTSFRSVVWIDNDDLATRVARSAKVGSVKAMISRQRGISGRVVNVEVIGTATTTNIKGDFIRAQAGGLRTNLFTTEYIVGENGLPEYFIMHTAGWGHGVGMDQSGAAGMAADGFKWQAILKHYYPAGILNRYEAT
jgi:stage II sporulation protein D